MADIVNQKLVAVAHQSWNLTIYPGLKASKFLVRPGRLHKMQAQLVSWYPEGDVTLDFCTSFKQMLKYYFFW